MKRLDRLMLALLVLSATVLPGCTKSKEPPPNNNVAILVVDDFGWGKDPTAGFNATENCTVGTTDVGSNGAGDALPPNMSHGEAVYRVAKEELSERIPTPAPVSTTTPRPSPSPGTPPSPPPFTGPIDISTDWTYPVGGTNATIRLVAVHADKYSTHDVLGGIKAKIETLRNADSGPRFDRFVLNMSFVVIPCDVIAWLSSSQLTELIETYNRLLEIHPELRNGLSDIFKTGGKIDEKKVKNPNPITANFSAEVLKTPLLTDMRSYLVSAYYRSFGQEVEIPIDPSWPIFPGDSPRIIPVAAAGNGIRYGNPLDPKSPEREGLPFPFAPAIWDSVVSVSANERANLNSGEVTLDGGGPKDSKDSFGSSFAAPRLSARQAIYLARTGNVACGQHQPPLGYVQYTGKMTVTKSTSPWQNIVANRWADMCGDFPG